MFETLRIRYRRLDVDAMGQNPQKRQGVHPVQDVERGAGPGQGSFVFPKVKEKTPRSFFPRRAMAARLASIPHLPGDTLVEFVLRRRLSLWVVHAQGGALHLPERRRTGGHQAWRRCWLAQMSQDVAHGTGVGDEGDDSHLAAAAWADERKDLMDPREQ